MVREQTLKSVLTLISKLSDRTVNGELLKYLAKTANDEQPGIRTNTTICLGKIAKNLGTSSRAKVLMAAFTRSLRDPFVHARNAALMALAVTSEYFSDEDCACRLLPALCPPLIDKEKLVRDQAAKTIDIYMQKIRKAAADMPDSVLPPQTTGDSVARMSTPQPSEQASPSWAGWAISSFTNKLSAAAGEIQSSSANGSSRPSSASPDAKRPSAPAPSTSSASVLARQALKSPPPSATFSSKAASSSAGAAPAATPEPYFPADDADDGWGDMDDAGADSFWDAPADDNAFGHDNDDDDNDGTPSSQPQSMTSSTTLPARASAAKATTTPFGGDDDEPDFAGWLAAQAQKKSGGGKPLPKGLAKGGANGKTTAAAVKKPLGGSSTAKKPVAAKKIDTAPKQTDDDDGWGDGW